MHPMRGPTLSDLPLASLTQVVSDVVTHCPFTYKMFCQVALEWNINQEKYFGSNP